MLSSEELGRVPLWVRAWTGGVIIVILAELKPLIFYEPI